MADDRESHVGVRMPVSLVEAIDRLAAEAERTRSQQIRHMLNVQMEER